MTNVMTRPAVLGGAEQPAADQHLDRSAWEAAAAKLQAERTRDRALDARHSEAQANGTLTEDLEQEWSDSIEPLGEAEWALFATDAPDLAAIDWKLKHLADHGMLEDQHVEQLRADIARLSSAEGR
ncbi:hypothetical protein [Sphingomonas sanguinis]|nr:hypothetical protein [Sphingomonas sanguinis]